MCSCASLPMPHEHPACRWGYFLRGKWFGRWRSREGRGWLRNNGGRRLAALQGAKRTDCVGVALYFDGNMRALAALMHHADRVPLCRHSDRNRVGPPLSPVQA